MSKYFEHMLWELIGLVIIIFSSSGQDENLLSSNLRLSVLPLHHSGFVYVNIASQLLVRGGGGKPPPLS
jgi:hypothetical protein